MPAYRLAPDHLRYPRGHLFGPWPDVPAPPPPKKPAGARRGRRCPDCRAAAPTPRSVMPLDHAVETVRGILIDRLDGGLDRLERIALESAGEHIEDAGTALRIAIRYIQETQVLLFPEEFGDGPAYTPDPRGRMDAVALPSGLVPRLPTVAIYARHLETGKASAAAGLSLPDGSPVFTAADLARLGERRERSAG